MLGSIVKGPQGPSLVAVFLYFGSHEEAEAAIKPIKSLDTKPVMEVPYQEVPYTEVQRSHDDKAPHHLKYYLKGGLVREFTDQVFDVVSTRMQSVSSPTSGTSRSIQDNSRNVWI